MLTIEIDGSRAVRIDFLNHAVQVVVGQLIVQFLQDFLQTRCGNETVALLVVQAERFLKFLLHGLSVLFNDELGSQLHELGELQTTGLCISQSENALITNLQYTFFNFISLTIFINLIDKLFEDFLVEGLSHQSQNVGDHVARDAARLLAVEAVECLLQHYSGMKNGVYGF